MKNKIKLAVFAVASLACVESTAQISTTPNVTSNCGGAGEDSGYKMEWTVAEFAALSLGNFTQGFHQPFLVKSYVSTVGIAETPTVAATALWPNPASNQLNLSFAGLASPPATVKLFGLDGKLLLSHQLNSGTTTTVIPIADLAAGSYVAVICDSRSTPMASHRFIKTL
jgi:Secretion system C-terminal sorting domain